MITVINSSCVTYNELKITKAKTKIQTNEHGLKNGRRLTFESTVQVSADTLWAQFQEPSFWINIMSPQAILKPLKKDRRLPDRWQLNTPYTFKLIMNGIIPFGKHHISFETMDSNQLTIQTREYGFLVPTWDNHFEIVPLTDSTCAIKDILDIQTNGVNGIVAAYAIELFKGKHKRLKKAYR